MSPTIVLTSLTFNPFFGVASVFDVLGSPEAIGWMATAIFTLLGAFGVWSHMTAARRAQLANIIHVASVGVQRAADETPGRDFLDVIAFALRSADDYARANGWRRLAPSEVQQARKLLEAAHQPRGPMADLRPTRR